MPLITVRHDFNGFTNLVDRLHLGQLVDEAESTLARFSLKIEEAKYANGTRDLRIWIDDGFEAAGGWDKSTVGAIDWTKGNPDSGGHIGVEVQVSGRSDLLAVDLIHLRGDFREGKIDVGIIVVPDDELSYYLTDRTPNFRTALKHIKQTRAEDLPIRVIAFRHDGVGTALPKMRTNLGRMVAERPRDDADSN